LNVAFNGLSSNENLNSVFGEKGVAAGEFLILLLRNCQEKIQIVLFVRRLLANFRIFLLTGSRSVKTLFQKGRLTVKKFIKSGLQTDTFIRTAWAERRFKF
jgi:hypothetical protein